MFKKILVPTDGSTLSNLAITKAIAFAKSINAVVYGFHAAPDYAMTIHGVDLHSSEKFRGLADEEARNYLAGIEAKAKEAGYFVHHGICRECFSLPCHHRCGKRTRLRSDLHGFAWQARIGRTAARK